MVAPVDVVRADVDDEAGIQLRDRARFRVVAPAAERVAGYRLPRSPILPVPHPLLRQHAVHPRRPERLTACTQSSAPSRHTDAECTFRIAFILWFFCGLCNWWDVRDGFEERAVSASQKFLLFLSRKNGVFLRVL